MTQEQQEYTQRLSSLYSLPSSNDKIDQAWLDEMLVRVNVLPEALVLTQAANESAWGHFSFCYSSTTCSANGVIKRAVELFQRNVALTKFMKLKNSILYNSLFMATL